MKINSRTDYAFACLLRLAEEFDGKKPIPINTIAKKENLEFDYVEQLFITMRRFGILKSIRGSKGGYCLARPADKITGKDVVEAIEKKTLEIICYRKVRKKKCIHIRECNVRSFWEEMKDKLDAFLDSYTIADLLELRRKQPNWK